MPSTLVAFDRISRHRSVIVEVHSEIDLATNADIEAIRCRMVERGVSSGILFASRSTYFVRQLGDGLCDVDDVATDIVLRGRTASLQDDVKRWLYGVSDSWWAFVPDEALRSMISVIVGGLSSASFEEWDRLLD